MRALIRYLKSLSPDRTVLWCYLIWYLVMAGFHFEASPALWLTSAGLSLIIGFALILSVARGPGARRLEPWQLVRLFLVPFCVSSFSALVKDQGFILIFSPRLLETGLAVALCACFAGLVVGLRRIA